MHTEVVCVILYHMHSSMPTEMATETQPAMSDVSILHKLLIRSWKRKKKARNG